MNSLISYRTLASIHKDFSNYHKLVLSRYNTLIDMNNQTIETYKSLVALWKLIGSKEIEGISKDIVHRTPAQHEITIKRREQINKNYSASVDTHKENLKFHKSLNHAYKNMVDISNITNGAGSHSTHDLKSLYEESLKLDKESINIYKEREHLLNNLSTLRKEVDKLLELLANS